MMGPFRYLLNQEKKTMAQLGLLGLGNLLPKLTGLEVRWWHDDWFSSIADG
jgi:hypothetical protein